MAARFAEHGLGVGGRKAIADLDQRLDVDPVTPQSAQQFVPHPIVADDTQRRNLDVQGAQVRGHRARRARAAPHVDYLVGLQACLQRDFAKLAVNDQVAI